MKDMKEKQKNLNPRYTKIDVIEVIRYSDVYLFKIVCPICHSETLNGIDNPVCDQCETDKLFVLNCERARFKNAVPIEDRKRRKIINKRTARRVYDLYDGHCAYCCVDLCGSYHIDHIYPLAAGGTNQFDNLALSCAPCNATASSLVFPNFSKKQEYIRRTRKLPS